MLHFPFVFSTLNRMHLFVSAACSSLKLWCCRSCARWCHQRCQPITRHS